MRRHLLMLLLTATFASACASSGTVTGPVAFPGAPGFPADHDATPPGPDAFAMTDAAIAVLGTPYQFGGADPVSGFDCSGLVRYALEPLLPAVPRTVEEQFTLGRPIRREDVRVGDLVFFSTIGPGATHVGIVTSLDGPPTFVHAPATGGVVRIESLDARYWDSRFVGARRLF